MNKEDQLGALWLNESKAGKKYMSGIIGGQKVVVFKNGYKEEDKHPDYIVYKSKPRGDEPQRSEDDFEDDQIPF